MPMAPLGATFRDFDCRSLFGLVLRLVCCLLADIIAVSAFKLVARMHACLDVDSPSPWLLALSVSRWFVLMCMYVRVLVCLFI